MTTQKFVTKYENINTLNLATPSALLPTPGPSSNIISVDNAMATLNGTAEADNLSISGTSEVNIDLKAGTDTITIAEGAFTGDIKGAENIILGEGVSAAGTQFDTSANISGAIGSSYDLTGWAQGGDALNAADGPTATTTTFTNGTITFTLEDNAGIFEVFDGSTLTFTENV